MYEVIHTKQHVSFNLEINHLIRVKPGSIDGVTVCHRISVSFLHMKSNMVDAAKGSYDSGME